MDHPTPPTAPTAASAALAFLSTVGAPPPSNPNSPSSQSNMVAPNLSPGELAIDAVNMRVADDLAYRAHQSAFLSGMHRRVAASSTGAKSLQELAVRQVAESLRYDVAGGLAALQKSPQILQEIVLEHMHYVSFRGLQCLPRRPVAQTDLLAKAAELDLEVWIIKNELIMRQEPMSVAGLLTLDDDLDIVFPGSVVCGEHREIRRRQPPKSNFCMFDERRSVAIRIQNTTAGYIRTFDTLTAGVLDGLDWNNVVVAGGIALNTLLRVEGGERPEEQVGDWVSADQDSDIDLYVYGLPTPAEANSKIEHIHAVWCRNVDKVAKAAGKPPPQKLIIRNSKTVNFLSDYPHRRVQVILKLVASPAEVLLNFDLDQCAIGFTGTNVLLLPRCARALETGYTVFTTDLVQGHHLGDRRETQLPRIYKYADRGFGIRILPQYLRHLEYRHLRFFQAESRDWDPSPPPADASPEELEHRKLKKGLKLLRMLAFYTEDFVHRLWVGPTARSKYVDSDGVPEDLSDLDDPDYDPDGDSTGACFEVNIGHFDGRTQNSGYAPHGKKGLGGFELLYWHETLWRKELEGLLLIKRDSFLSPSYEPDGYAELPKYEWNAEFTAEGYAATIVEYNDYLYRQMKEQQVPIDFDRPALPTHAFEDYFSRRTERLTCNTTGDIAAVLKRELALPVFLPLSFEEFANRTLATILPDSAPLLVPIHMENAGRGVIPELPRTDYNWVFWCINPDVNWARIDRRIDEVFELLWEFFNISVLEDCGLFRADSRSAWAGVLHQHLSRRGPRAPVSDAAASVEWPGARETWAFRQWIREEPVDVDLDSAGYQGMMGHRRFRSWDAQLDNNDQEKEEKTYWGDKYEAGTLGEWLLWGEEMGVGSKRKRESIDGRPAKRMAKRIMKREAVEEEGVDLEELEDWEEEEGEEGEEDEEGEEEEPEDEEEGDEQEEEEEEEGAEAEGEGEGEGENMDVEVR